MPIQIGPYTLQNRLVLAPMAGVTDLPFRNLCRRFGASLAASEMVSANTELWSKDSTRRRLDHRGEATPRVVQIAGSEPKMLAEAAKRSVEGGAQIVDINMGCPAKKVCKKLAGSALLSDERLVARILDATVKAVNVPVTLKIRTGPDPTNKNGVRIAKMAELLGIQSLAVHGRTRQCRFKGQAEYQTIQSIAKAVDIPVFANGDCDTPEKAREILKFTGADGLMIGRGAQGRPWIFRDIDRYLETGRKVRPPTSDQVHDIMRRHLENLYEFYGESLGVRIARKHVVWYCKDRPGFDKFRKSVMGAETASRQLGQIKQFFDRLSTGEDLAA
ncbi:MAG: tRNA dihydrouridine synthase DusB [Pseudomonadota bacterium]